MPEWPQSGKTDAEIAKEAREAALIYSEGFAPGFAG